MIADKFTILLSTDGTITALNCLKLVEPVEVKSGDIVEFFDLDLENKTCRCQIRREVTSMTTEPEKLARIETTQIPTAALDEELIGIPYLKEDIVIGETVFESVSGAEEKCRKINASYLTKSNARVREALEAKEAENAALKERAEKTPRQIEWGHGRVRMERFEDKTDGSFGLLLTDADDGHKPGETFGGQPEKDHTPKEGEFYLRFANEDGLRALFDSLRELFREDPIRSEQIKAERERDEAVRAERERCAMLVDVMSKAGWDFSTIAAKIRSGEEKANG